jgi:hypothetical protein
MKSTSLPKINSALLSMALLTWPVHAQETDATIKAYAAGYKAAFTCSATFNAAKSPSQIAKHELKGIYPLVADQVKALPDAKIDIQNKRVSVFYSDTMPPRVSQWREHLGCVQLPVGATVKSAADYLPTIQLTSPARNDNAPWKTLTPINTSSGNAKLDAVVKAAFKGDTFNTNYGENAFTTAVLIATPDQIITEQYIDGYTHKTSQRTWSVAKSIAATVIGAAVEQDIIDVKAPAPIEEWQTVGDPRGNITLENLLQMASGLDSNRAGNRTDRLYIGGGRVQDTSSRTAVEATPGTRWKYANNDTLLAMRALRGAIKNDQAYLKFPFKSVMHKIGMLDTKPETDWGGDFILSSQVWTTSRDMARLGILYLNNGVWNGERILPENWTEYVSSPAPAQPLNESTPGYGAQFWLYNDRFPELPNDAFAARGNRGQHLMIIPSKNLVIIRRGYDPAKPGGFQLHTFTKDVLDALE